MKLNEDREEEVVPPLPGQLCSQLCDLQDELQVRVLTLSHRPEQAAVLLVQSVLSILEFSHGCQQVFALAADRQALSGNGGKMR